MPTPPSPALTRYYFAVTRTAAVCYFIFTLYALFSPHPHLERIGIPSFSVIHTVAFLVLGGIFELARGKYSFWKLYILLFLYGPLTECLQPLTGRYFEWNDILEDCLGVTAGVLIALKLKNLWSRRFGNQSA